MSEYIEDEDFWGMEEEIDEYEKSAEEEIMEFFEKNKENVFFSRQIEVIFEQKYFHWVSNRAIRSLVASKRIQSESREIAGGIRIHLLWHRNYRYYKRDAKAIVKLVEEYAAPSVAGSIGIHGELIVLEGFARFQYVLMGRSVNGFKGKQWNKSNHNLDFIFYKDGISYGVEVKNTLGYMEYKELQLKIEMCRELGIRPVFVSRMMPKTWIHQIGSAGGFALILKYQLYPLSHKNLAERVAKRLKLPVDSPRSIEDGTMKRFENWHNKVKMK
ncbi:MAG: hypothetical protein PHI34_10800 [Acidobacteriota bacterium]|nr:hypothetical protein [Acidobacteriota bacterium]